MCTRAMKAGKRDSSSSAELIVLSMRLNSLSVFFIFEIEHNFYISSQAFGLLETVNCYINIERLFKLF